MPLGALAQLGFRVRDAQRDHFFVAATCAPGIGPPRHGFHDQFGGLVPAVMLLVVAVAYADKAFAEPLKEFPGSGLAGSAGQPDLHARITTRRCRG